MKKPTLSPRLKLIADLVENSEMFADIGTDHAYLPVYLCLENRCKSAIASDIRPGPLNRAESTIIKYQLGDRIRTRLGAGLETINFNDRVDTAVIAGMGGIMISEILEKSIGLVIRMEHIILQPMTMVPELREYIYNKNLGLVREYIAIEQDKIYNIISIKINQNMMHDKNVHQTPCELYIGKDLIDARPENYDIYIDNQIRKLEKLIIALKDSSSDVARERLKSTTALLEEVLKCK